jgi:hypothetical protein
VLNEAVGFISKYDFGMWQQSVLYAKPKHVAPLCKNKRTCFMGKKNFDLSEEELC